MSVPEVRARLRELAAMPDMAAPLRAQLTDLADKLRRSSPVRRSYISSARLTPMLIREIAAYVEAHPHVPFHEIAAKFNVNPGRVSEIATGRRRAEL